MTTAGSPRTRVLFVVAAIALVAVAAFVRLRTASREGIDLKPRPDALEYGVAAKAIVERGAYELPIGDVSYPPRYPPGFSVLAAPFVAWQDGDPSAVRDAALTFGLLLVLVVAGLGMIGAGWLGAVVAGAVVALSPLAVEQSGLAMSETASALLVALALASAAAAFWRRPTGEPRGRLLLLAGVIGAVAATVRYTNLAVLLPIFLFVGTRHAFAPGAGRRGRAAIAVIAPAVIAVAAIALYHLMTFGHPLHDGYRFWVPEIYENPGIVISARYVAQGIPGYWDEGHLAVYGRELVGGGSLLGGGAALLGLLGFVRFAVLATRCPVARLLSLVTVTMLPAVLLFHLVYFWQDPRFLVPLLPLLAVLAGSGAEAVRAAAARLVPRRGRAATSVVVGAAVALAAVFTPARTLAEPVLRSETIRPLPPLMEWLPTLDADLERDAIVICNFPVTLASPYLGDRREIIVTNRNTADPHLNAIGLHQLRGEDGRATDIRALAVGDRLEPETLDHVVRWAREGRPVYYVAVAGEAPAGAGVSALSTRGLETVESIARPPITVYEVRFRR